MTQLIRRIRIDQQRNAFGIAINPTAMLIPPADFGAGCRIRLLCENQQLLLKGIFEVIFDIKEIYLVEILFVYHSA